MFSDAFSGNEARFDVETAPSPGWIATKIRFVCAGAESESEHVSAVSSLKVSPLLELTNRIQEYWAAQILKPSR
jgi:hypothetical protein